MKNKFYLYIQTLQDQICAGLEAADGATKFREDIWERPEGGGGRTRVIENGAVFEKGGVNISAVHGKLPESMQKLFNVGEADFFACGLSLVIHPKSPMVPTVHANWRYFEMYDDNGNVINSWFGGGQDLTPYYLFEEDAIHFHQTCKTACDKHNTDFYSKYKKQCDDYFWNAHRNAYVPIVEKRKNLPYSSAQRTWQEIRRGRYVEFNLVHDKGTLFGLKTNGRIESILMSLPPRVQWAYDHHAEKCSEEERLVEVLENPKNWLSAFSY